MTRKQVFYSGTVQGVGFRWSALRAAAGYAVTGYVRNLDDGRVELVAEGPPAEVDGFLTAVAGRMAGYITAAEVEVQPPTGQFDGFRMAR